MRYKAVNLEYVGPGILARGEDMAIYTLKHSQRRQVAMPSIERESILNVKMRFVSMERNG